MNATERVVEYSNIATEPESGLQPPAAWPTAGHLAVSNLVVGYAPDLPPVLNGVSFEVEPNTRLGVVGRTGAGKSSLTLALFRFLEAREGTILIDGVDISTIRLYDLRSRLAIIPQDPVLFSGTVRSNLDPFDQHEDWELRDALARVHLIPSAEHSKMASGVATPVKHTPGSAIGAGAGASLLEPPPTPSSTLPTKPVNIFSSLSSPIAESGLNLSQGQRQLLCLARAIVSRPKILVLDEATSAVDLETDALIQRSIREEFRDTTMVVIAHRLSTIADFERVLVLGEGRVREWGSPGDLMGTDRVGEQEGKKVGGEGAEDGREGNDTRKGEFRRMVEESGERRELEAIIFGKNDGES